MNNILITSAGKRVSLLRAFQHELKLIYPNAKVFAADSKPHLSAACQIADDWFKVPLLSDKNYIHFLLEKCILNKISLIIPTIDTELLILSKNRKIFLENGITPVISNLELIKICRDKRLLHVFFNKNEIETAIEYKKENIKFPLFIKPYNGSRSNNTFIISKKEELTSFHLNNESLMFLEYLDHKEYTEFTCDLYYAKDNTLKCVVPRKRIEVRDGEINKGKTIKNELVNYILERLYKIDGAKGCLTAQFFMHNSTKRIVGIEINPRFGGGYPLSYLAGANFPKWIIEEYILNKKISFFEEWENNLLMLRYDKEVLIHSYGE